MITPAAASLPGGARTHTDQVATQQIIMRARRLEIAFGTTRALRGVDLDIAAGQVLTVTGPSGSGKSTLLHVLAGILVNFFFHLLPFYRKFL